MSKRMVNLTEIAKEASVSIATASMVLNRRDKRISEATRRQVLEVAQKLSYRPNLLMHGVKTGKTRTIGVMVPIRCEFEGKILGGIHDELIAQDHVPIVVWSKLDSPTGEGDDELTQIHRLVDRRVDGIIISPLFHTVDDTYLKEVWNHRLPLVTVDHELAQTHADFIGTDDELGGRMVAEYFLKLGHRRLGQVAGPKIAYTGRRRQAGFEQVATAAGAECQTVWARSFSGEDPDDQEMITRWLATEKPTAVFVGNDLLARQVYLSVRHLNLNIPRDLSVVGFGELEFSSWMDPPLTTVHQRPRDIGRFAARLLLDRIREKNKSSRPCKLRLKPLLVVRSSAAPGHHSLLG